MTEIAEPDEQIKKVPKRIFIVPYRNRVQQKFFFEKYMTSVILEGETDYEVYFSHQCDARSFNRGATKNIGFLAIKKKYPEDYQDITLIFNDVDTIPFNKIFDYQTTPGIVKHYYGFEYTLGGIVVIKAGDLEMINGFPNFWAWGNEDNCLQKRCEMHNIIIDRSVFYKIGSPEILQLFDGISRIISKRDPMRLNQDNGRDGIRTVHKLAYTIDKKSLNSEDNIFVVDNPRISIINITSFLTGFNFEADDYYNYDLREPTTKLLSPDDTRKTENIFVTTNDWSNIPYYPTIQERKELATRQNISRPNPRSNPIANPNPVIRQPVKPQTFNPKHPGHMYSPEYARYIGAPVKAAPSATIRLGGVKRS